ncbi:MAG: GDP-mannose 4,6-dehydratase [Candidatus Daviesbacteria bacterium]|nr:GDP-mannose 4,6-dehydratase [Candidatus Daviesbacteria bacterium]
MKIIVTGGAGFLGSHLCDKLVELDHQVICIDNLLTGSLNNIAHLQQSPNFQFVQADAGEGLPQDLDFDQIYHLASPASPNKDNPKSYQALPFDTMQVNTFGTWSLCEEALARGAKFLFASTSEVYGDPLEHPQKETYNGNVSTTGPRSVYDEAKRFGETVTSAFVRYNNLDARIVRIFNTYGPRMAPDGRVVIEFVTAALFNKPFPVFGDGKQTRSFCFVSDLIDGLALAMEKGVKGEIYNLGNPQEFTILELAEKVKLLTNAASEISSVGSLPKDDPIRRCPDIQKARETLGWEPKVSLEEGLKKLIVYLQTKQKP